MKRFMTAVLVALILVGCAGSKKTPQEVTSTPSTIPAGVKGHNPAQDTPSTPTTATSQSVTASDSAVQPRVLWFKVTTSDGTYEAADPTQNGQALGGVVKKPEVKLEAAVHNADAVRFVIESIVGKEGPIEQVGPLKPDASGRVEADWILSRPGFTYIIWAAALRKPSTPPSQGDMVDSQGNLVGVSGTVRLELDQGN